MESLTTMKVFVYAPLQTATPDSSEDGATAGQRHTKVAVVFLATFGAGLAVLLVVALFCRCRNRRNRNRRRNARMVKMIAAAAAARWDVELRERRGEVTNDINVSCYPGTTAARREDTREDARCCYPPFERSRQSRRESRRESARPVSALTKLDHDMKPTEGWRIDSLDFSNLEATMDDAGAEYASHAEPDAIEKESFTTNEHFGDVVHQDEDGRLAKASTADDELESPVQMPATAVTIRGAGLTTSRTDDMWERRAKAKSRELSHLKGALAYPAAVHTAAPSGRGGPRSAAKRTADVSWIQGGRTPQNEKPVQKVELYDGSWTSFETGSDKTQMARNDSWKTMEDYETRSVHTTLKGRRNCRAHEEEWEDIPTLASRPSDQSLQLSPMRAREI